MATYGFPLVTSLSNVDWNTWVNLGNAVTTISCALSAPPEDESAEIKFTFTTASTVSTPFFNFGLPAGYAVRGDYTNPKMLPNRIYQASLFNTGQEVQEDGNTVICLGLIVYPWDYAPSN